MIERTQSHRHPLVWRLLVPFVSLLILVGAAGGILLVRDLSSRAKSMLDQDLLRRSLEARSLLHDRELYLLESARFAANLQGMPDAVSSNDAARVRRLLRSVVTLKKDLAFVMALDSREHVKAELHATGASAPTPWPRPTPLAAKALGTGEMAAGLLDVNSISYLVIAAPVCAATSDRCVPVGVAVVGITAVSLAQEASGTDFSPRTAAAIYDEHGRMVSASPGSPKSIAATNDERLVRRTLNGTATLLAPYRVKGARVGSVSVSIPTESAFGPVRTAGRRLGLVLVVALLGVIAAGFAVSRSIVRQIRPLIEANRALAEGDLTARADERGDEEISELARGLNHMADELQANVATLEARVAERTAEIERLLKERTEFFAGLSHELRTPLAAILGEAAIILESDRASRGEAISIKRSAEQLLGAVNDILELAKAESGSIEVDIEDVRIADVVKTARTTIDGLAKAGGVRLRVRIPRDLPHAKADAARLREVLVNLVDNAVKYTPAGGEVVVSAAANNGAVSILVSDTGIGIPADVGDRVFEPFVRVKGTRAHRGQPSSGLGLALAKRFTEAQGGDLSFEPRDSGGTTFTVMLNAAR